MFEISQTAPKTYTMKKFIFLFAFTFALIAQASAATIVSKNDHNDLVRNIRKQLHFDEKFKKSIGTSSAIVNFIVNDKGAIEVKEIITDNPKLKDDIARQMTDMPIYKTPVYPNTLYTMKVNFKLQ